MDSLKSRIWLLVAGMIVALALFLMVRNERSKSKMSEEMKTGVKALTDPESLLKDQ
jgi:YbbR domain-containing protein